MKRFKKFQLLVVSFQLLLCVGCASFTKKFEGYSARDQFIDKSAYFVQRGDWLRCYDDLGYIGAVRTRNIDFNYLSFGSLPAAAGSQLWKK
jgi:hypothetical protein